MKEGRVKVVYKVKEGQDRKLDVAVNKAIKGCGYEGK